MSLCVGFIENAGAEKGVLFLKRDCGFCAEAESRAGEETARVLHAAPLEKCVSVPKSVVRLVVRTGETVVLDSAAEIHTYSGDRYFREY